MPLFYFHICDDDGAVPDQEGLALSSEEEAIREGKASALELLIHDLRDGRPLDHRRIEIRNAHGDIIGIFPLRDMIN